MTKCNISHPLVGRYRVSCSVGRIVPLQRLKLHANISVVTNEPQAGFYTRVVSVQRQRCLDQFGKNSVEWEAFLPPVALFMCVWWNHQDLDFHFMILSFILWMILPLY